MYSLALFALVATQGVHAWGTLGHDTVAFVAQNFVNDATEDWAQDILNDTTSSYLANVATWADSYRYTSEGSFSKPFHFIDAEDNPPSSCSVDFDRDCPEEGCSVSAIANYTQRVQSSSLSKEQVNYALRFIIHFLGDITQPLHDEALEIGGNSINVTFGGEDTNLHHIWDTNMPEMLQGGYSLSDAKAWASNLTIGIKSGAYKSKATSWIKGDSISDAKASAMTWAQDANKYVCSVVIPDGQTAVETGDLSGAYYNSAIETIELQIAKAGYRLANWLDQLAGAQSNGTSRLTRRRAHVVFSGEDLLPGWREPSKALLARRAIGWGCNHPHDH